MRKETAEFEGTSVWFFYWPEPADFLKQRKRMHPEDHMLYCAITGDLLDPEDGVIGVVCNYELFPNCNVSEKLVDQLGFTETIKRIKQSWELAKEFKKKNKQWL